MKNEMRLQGIGMVEGTEAGKIQVGDILRWNHGGLSRVISFELSKTGKTINCQVEVVNSRTGEKEIYERSMRTSRLVNIVASANTNNDFNLQFDPIKEEAPEAEEENNEIADFKTYTELLEKVYSPKTTATEEEQEELERLAYKLKLNGVPDAISEMNFDRLQKQLEKKASSDIKKIKFYDLQKIKNWKKAVVVFTEDSFEKEFTEVERSYQISSDAKYFDANMGGNSLFGNCLDGKDLGVRLDIYIYNGWKVDYAYITKYKEVQTIPYTG